MFGWLKRTVGQGCVHPTTHPRTHCHPTGPSWLPASFCCTRGHFHVSVPLHERGSERGKAARENLSLCRCRCSCQTGRPVPSDHLRHRRTVLSNEACEQTSRELLGCRNYKSTLQYKHGSRASSVTAIDGLRR